MTCVVLCRMVVSAAVARNECGVGKKGVQSFCLHACLSVIFAWQAERERAVKSAVGGEREPK